MKSLISCSLLLSYVLIINYASAQKGVNEFEKTRVQGVLDGQFSSQLSVALKGDDAGVITLFQDIFLHHRLSSNNSAANAGFSSTKGSQVSLNAISDAINQTITTITDYGSQGEGGENAAVIFIYRDMIIGNGVASSKIDFESLKTLIFHKQKNKSDISNYLLVTKKIYLVFIDLDDDFYANNGSGNEDKKLANTVIKINYKTSFFKKSFQDTKSLWQNTMGSDAIPNPAVIKLTLVEVDSKRIKDPCDIVCVNKTIDESRLTFPIHERNLASFQVGVENTKYALNNFSIESGNLVVKPNDDQKEAWKSSLYSLLEIHIPRDIDNFNPLWKDVFSKGRDRSAGQYFYDAIISRIGIYGGIKISKDPLSNLYSGFNFAITKELSVNLGWTWTNQITPQVTNIGDITSLDDAKEYAKRSYSKGKFSWGLSFSPSAIIDMFKSK